MYTLRKSNSTDSEFAYEVVRITMREFALQTWGVWLDEECKDAAIRESKEGDIQIIYFGSDKVGILLYESTETEIVLNQLYLLPQFQEKGIGREIISDLKQKSLDCMLPINLSVLLVNSAKEFYLKNGFIAISATDERVLMQYSP